MFNSRIYSRALVLGLLLWRKSLSWKPRTFPANPKRILIAHNLLLGDALMCTALLAKVRHVYPDSEIFLFAGPTAYLLYEKKPYGVTALLYNPKNPTHLFNMLKIGGFDLALIPGDNRLGKVAYAAGSQHIRAFEGDTPSIKNRFIDELLPFPKTPTSWADMNGFLIPGPNPPSYDPSHWPDPSHKPFTLPKQEYVILHVGCSTPLKQWNTEKWQKLALHLSESGLLPIWSAGSQELAIVKTIDPGGQFPSIAGQLDLCQMWHLLKGAKCLISCDTSIAHMGRLTNTPTLALFGPGSALLCGAGRFWSNSPYKPITVNNFFCRNQNTLFRRQIPWVLRCGRSTKECQTPRCMQAISLDAVLANLKSLISRHI